MIRGALIAFTLLYVTPALAWDCDSLRRACNMRDELGERGQGNCQRYHDRCTGSQAGDHCARLREACMYKKENDEEGQGNCKKYREECSR